MRRLLDVSFPGDRRHQIRIWIVLVANLPVSGRISEAKYAAKGIMSHAYGESASFKEGFKKQKCPYDGKAFACR